MTIFHIYLLHLNNSLLWWHTAKSFFPPMKRKGLFKLKKSKTNQNKMPSKMWLYELYIIYGAIISSLHVFLYLNVLPVQYFRAAWANVKPFKKIQNNRDRQQAPFAAQAFPSAYWGALSSGCVEVHWGQHAGQRDTGVGGDRWRGG